MSLGQVPNKPIKDPLEQLVDKVVLLGGKVKHVSVTNIGYELKVEIPKEVTNEKENV